MELNTKLHHIFKFLQANREYNFRLHNYDFVRTFSSCSSNDEKAFALLHGVFFTQSQPKLNKAADFFISLMNHNGADKPLTSFSNFYEFLKSSSNHKNISKKVEAQLKTNYNGLFILLSKQNGWGDKTAALFVKHLFQIHSEGGRKQFTFWNDTPERVESGDRLHLPVDAVMNFIFKEISPEIKGFSKINEAIYKEYKGADTEVWDDLWFWGFITQNSSGDGRKMEFNKGKYWALMGTPKEAREVDAIRKKAEKFIQIIKS